MPMSQQEHKAHGPASVACFVLTVSDTRTADTDTSGRAIRDLLGGSGHSVSGHAIVPDDPSQVRRTVLERITDTSTQVVITTGGTGITSRDGTYEAIAGMLDKQLDGFGELFRMLSFQEIGSAAMMSRATAGTLHGKAIFVLPGSENAVRLAMTRLIIPELPHVVQQVSK
jgi:molybdopterin adenylyltransferase